MDMSIPVSVQRVILEDKIKFHKMEYFGYQAESQVAQDVGGLDAMLASAMDKMKVTLKVVVAFQKQLDALPTEEEQP